MYIYKLRSKFKYFKIIPKKSHLHFQKKTTSKPSTTFHRNTIGKPSQSTIITHHPQLAKVASQSFFIGHTPTCHRSKRTLITSIIIILAFITRDR